MAKSLGRACAQFAILLLSYGSIIECVKTASDFYDVSASLLPHIYAHEPVRLTADASETSHERARRAAPGRLPAAPAPEHTDEKTQYQSVSLNGNGSVTPTDATVNTMEAAASNGSISYNVGVNGAGQRKDYGTQTSVVVPGGGEAASAAAATTTTTTINVADAAKKGPQLLAQSQYPKKVAASSNPAAGSPTTPSSTDRALIDDADIPEEVIQKETAEHNLTRQEDHHDYYNSTTYVDLEKAKSMWLELSKIPENEMLSSSHRRAVTVNLQFDFPFYGYFVRNVTVATGGFLYTGDYVHSWLAATQYIAPLMANFDTSISSDSFVRVQDNGTSFTVVWENVALQDKREYGKFTFSATLHKNGDIVFVYHQVPIHINAIQDNQHPVKVGLSDAYIIDKYLYFARRKTIYEYHRVTFNQGEITNGTTIYLTALPTCLGYNDCQSCINHSTTFSCTWCPVLNRCSTGTDRRKHDWLQKGCDHAAINNASACPALGQRGNNAAAQDTNGSGSGNAASTNSSSAAAGTPAPNSNPNTSATAAPSAATESVVSSTQHPLSGNGAGKDDSKHEQLNAKMSAVAAETKSVGMAFGFLVPICMVFAVTLWLFYAYRNPHTRSGQLLIQFRPSQWSWRRGEARYTAATIHM